MIQVIAFVLFVTLANVSGWASCSHHTSIINNDYPCENGDLREGYEEYVNSQCANTMKQGGLVYINCGLASGKTAVVNNCGYCTNSSWLSPALVDYTCCSNKCEADSVACINRGGRWEIGTTAGDVACGGKACQICKDTSWTSYGCVYDVAKGQYRNSIIYHEIKDCLPLQQQTDYYAAKCDSSSNDSSLTCMGSTDGVNVYVRGGRGKITTCEADGSCSLAIQKIVAGQCEDPNDTPKPNSSGGGGSSSSGAYSSSDGESSSSSDDGESSGSGNVNGDYGEILDTLHMMHKTQESIDSGVWGMYPYISGLYDGQIELNGTAHDINQNLLTSLDFLSEIRDNTNRLENIESKTNSIDSKMSTANSNLSSINSNIDGVKTNTANINRHVQETNQLLTNLNEKNWSPEINVEVGGDTNIINVDNQVTIQGDTTIVNITNNVDTTRAPKVIEGLLDNYIGAFNSFVDKFTGFFGDTSGWNGDTTGWGSSNDSAKKELDSTLKKSNWVASLGCDTTGGKKCDKSIIGAHGMDSAKTQIRSTYRALGDSLRNGAFGDSLENWGNKFTGNGVLSGSGSNSCPSILTRSWHVTIGPTGFDMTIGRYLCSPIFGNVTAWTLCRLLLRAGVALACMWFLFKCAVGFKGDDD